MQVVYVILVFLFSTVLYLWIYIKVKKKECEKYRSFADKHLEMFLLLDRWIQNKQEGKEIGDYLKKNGFENVIIYGMSYIGKLLYKELANEDITIKYLIDQKENIIFNGIEVKNIKDKIDSADVIIVTSIYYFEEIEEKIGVKFDCPIVSFADIVYKIA